MTVVSVILLLLSVFHYGCADFVNNNVAANLQSISLSNIQKQISGNSAQAPSVGNKPQDPYISNNPQASNTGNYPQQPQGQPCTGCCQELSSGNVQTVPVGDIAESTPVYTKALEGDSVTNVNTVDSRCITYFNISDGAFLAFRGVRLRNGSGYVEKIFNEEVGSSTYTQTGLVGNPPNTSRIALVKIIYQTSPPCPPTFSFIGRSFSYNYQSGCGSNFDIVRFVDSSVPYPPEECVNQALQVFNSPDLPPLSEATDFQKLPNKLPFYCITEYLGAKCINADKVPPAYRNSINSNDDYTNPMPKEYAL